MLLRNHKEEKIHVQYLYVFTEKKIMYKWTSTVQTHVIKGSTAYKITIILLCKKLVLRGEKYDDYE